MVATEPMSWDGRAALERLGVELVRSDRFLCHYDEFADWAEGRKQLKMEDFYRWQRTRLDVLMETGPDGPEPVGAGGTSITTTANRPRATGEPGRRSPASNSTRSIATSSPDCRPTRTAPTPTAPGR